MVARPVHLATLGAVTKTLRVIEKVGAQGNANSRRIAPLSRRHMC